MRILEIPAFLLGAPQLKALLETAVDVHKQTENPELVAVIGALRAEISRREQTAHTLNRYGSDVVRLLRGRPHLHVIEGEGDHADRS